MRARSVEMRHDADLLERGSLGAKRCGLGRAQVPLARRVYTISPFFLGVVLSEEDEDLITQGGVGRGHQKRGERGMVDAQCPGRREHLAAASSSHHREQELLLDPDMTQKAAAERRERDCIEALHIARPDEELV